MIYISDELMVEFSHRRNRNEYLFEDNPEFYLYFGMFFLCALLIITWSYFECTDTESVTKAGFQIVTFWWALYLCEFEKSAQKFWLEKVNYKIVSIWKSFWA